MLALTPSRYLAEGFLDEAGQMRPGLLGNYAMAAAVQLLEAELSPQEFAFTLEAMKYTVPMTEGEPPPVQAMEALLEALRTVGRMIRQPNNEGLVRWSRDCAAQVRQAGDIPAWLAHMGAVLKRLGLLASLPTPS
jgi:hypothetical protein